MPFFVKGLDLHAKCSTTEVGKGKMYIQVKLHHCAFYQYNHCYINSYLDEDSAPTIVPTIKGLNRDVGLHGKT